jgi:hypothetical protein
MMDLGSIAKTGIKAAVNAVTGGLGGAIWDMVEGALPADLPPDQRAQLKMALEREITARQVAAEEAANAAASAVTARAASLEGTASDLAALPILGRVILFLRGSQRPAWGFAVLALDWQVFSGAWYLPEAGALASAFWLINLLVLGFLFGERAVQNVLPAVSGLLAARKGGGA